MHFDDLSINIRLFCRFIGLRLVVARLLCAACGVLKLSIEIECSLGHYIPFTSHGVHNHDVRLDSTVDTSHDVSPTNSFPDAATIHKSTTNKHKLTQTKSSKVSS